MKTMQRLRFNPSLIDAAPSASEIRRLALAGLSKPQKTLPCSLFYDDVGAALFEQICELPEYYPTRTEIGILRQNIDDISESIGPGARLVELGSGEAIKTRILLRSVAATEYVPVDISRVQLLDTVEAIGREFPHTRVHAVCADYTQELQLPPAASRIARTVIFFPGSTIGNFEPADAERFLRALGAVADPRGGLLIGTDLQKDRQRIEAAYNDRQGVTAHFNLNVLVRLNRQAGANFDVAKFQHRAIYNQIQHRIEMHLVSRQKQEVRFAPTRSSPDAVLSFGAGEKIVTEHSYKYSIAGFAKLAASAGWQPKRTWVDADSLFAVHWCEII